MQEKNVEFVVQATNLVVLLSILVWIIYSDDFVNTEWFQEENSDSSDSEEEESDYEEDGWDPPGDTD